MTGLGREKDQDREKKADQRPRGDPADKVVVVFLDVALENEAQEGQTGYNRRTQRDTEKDGNGDGDGRVGDCNRIGTRYDMDIENC